MEKSMTTPDEGKPLYVSYGYAESLPYCPTVLVGDGPNK